MLTFLSKEEIESIEKEHNEHPELRQAHKALAKEIITDIHGEAEYEKAVKISESLFSEKIKELSADDIIRNLKDIPSYQTAETNLIDLLVNSKICSSKREAKEMITNNAISINSIKVNDLDKQITKNDFIDNKVMLIKKGKKNYFMIIFK